MRIHPLLLASIFLSLLGYTNSQPLDIKQLITKRYTTEQPDIISNWDPDDGLPRARLYNRAGIVTMFVHIGSPPQTVELLVDTGSDVTWVNSQQNPYCTPVNTTSSQLDKRSVVMFSGMQENKGRVAKEKGTLLCDRYGVYNSSASSTSTEDTKQKSKQVMRYMDSTTVNGRLVMDNITIGNDLSVESFPFVIATEANSTYGVIALAPPSFERDKKGKLHYRNKNLVRELQKAGKIDRAVFSVWLNHDSSTHGDVLFGGIDLAKMSGPMLTLKMAQRIQDNPGPQTRYEVLLSNIYLDQHDHKNNKTTSKDIFNLSPSFQNNGFTTAIIDTGSSISYFPEELLHSLISQIDGAFEMENGRFAIMADYNLDKDLVTNDSISFKFGQSVSTIPLKHFLTKYAFMSSDDFHDVHGNKLDSDKDYYMIGLAKASGAHSRSVILGQNFMRPSYIVFDLDRMEISIAPAVYTPKSHVRKLGKAEPVGGIADGIMEEARALYRTPELYDPRRDFVYDTDSAGYYIDTFTSGAGRREFCSGWVWVISVIVGFMCCL